MGRAFSPGCIAVLIPGPLAQAGMAMRRCAFTWPGTSEIYLIQESSALTFHQRMSLSNSFVDTEFQGVGSFDPWLQKVTGLSLKDIPVPSNTPFPEHQGKTLFDVLGLFYPFPRTLAQTSFYLSYLQQVILPENSLRGESWRLVDDTVRQLTVGRIGLRDTLEQAVTGQNPPPRVRTRSGQEVQPASFRVGGLDNMRVAPTSGDVDSQLPSSKLFACQRILEPARAYRSTFHRLPFGALTIDHIPLSPLVTDTIEIKERLTATERQERRDRIKAIWLSNSGQPKVNGVYLEEAFYFVPIHLALQVVQER